MSIAQRFHAIREAYAQAVPEWMEDYENTGNMFFDPYLMDWDMSPIESNVWGDIRDMCLPFYPQFPALNYFIDFGNPFLKIGIECDGKQWHDAVRDQARDARLAKAGWMIFRLQGHECVRQVRTHREYSDEIITPETMERYYASTSEGVLRAIKASYFNDECIDSQLMQRTVIAHRSTPETNPQRLPIRPRTSPARMSDLLNDYRSLILKRAAQGRQA